MFPDETTLRTVSTTAVLAGLFRPGLAAFLGAVDNVISRQAFGREVEDLSDLPESGKAPLR
jgi:hypothetical protein